MFDQDRPIHPSPFSDRQPRVIRGIIKPVTGFWCLICVEFVELKHEELS